MKKVIALIYAMLMIALLCGCTDKDPYFGFTKQDFTIVEENDTHGGFLGDGEYYLILDCSDNTEKALENIEGWNSLPLSENLELAMFGGEKDGEAYGYMLSELAHMPKIENGYYFFEDRFDGAEDPSDDSELLSRYSFNFSLAVYDCDTNLLYFFAFDT